MPGTECLPQQQEVLVASRAGNAHQKAAARDGIHQVVALAEYGALEVIQLLLLGLVVLLADCSLHTHRPTTSAASSFRHLLVPLPLLLRPLLLPQLPLRPLLLLLLLPWLLLLLL